MGRSRAPIPALRSGLPRHHLDVTVDSAGRTDLHYAALENDLAKARAALSEGSDPSVKDKLGFTPLHFAAQQQSTEVAELLLENGAEVDAANEYGNTPLFVAVFNSRDDGSIVCMLRERGAD